MRNSSRSNLLSLIDDDMVINNILPRMPTREAREYVDSISNASDKLKSFDKNNTYWKRRTELLLNKGIPIIPEDKNAYDVNWHYIYDLISYNKDGLPVIETVKELDGTHIQKLKEDNIPNIKKLFKPKYDNPDYINIAIDIGYNFYVPENAEVIIGNMIYRAMLDAAKKNHIKIISYLIDNYEADISVLETAVEYGHLDIMKLLIEDREKEGEIDYDKLLKIAVKNNHPNMVKWLLDRDEVNLKTEFRNNRGNLEELMDIINHGIPNYDDYERLSGNIPESSLTEAILHVFAYNEEKADQTIKVLLEHNKTSEYTILSIFEPNYWIMFLKSIYDINMKRENIERPKDLISVYLNIKEVELLTTEYGNKYKYGKDNELLYKEIRDKLGKMLLVAYTLPEFRYLVEQGCPITYNNGNALVRAVKNWGIDALEIIDRDRLIFYMNDKDRAWNLLKIIAESKWKHAKPMFKFLIGIDNEISNNERHAYSRLLREYKSDVLLVNYIKRELKGKRGLTL